jgi:predicted secreted protein
MAINAMGTKLKKGTVEIAHLSSIAGLELTAETIDVTALDTTGGYKEFIAGSKDAGEVGIEGFFDGTDHEALILAFESGDVETYTIEFPDVLTTSGSKWTFSAVVTGITTGSEVDNAVSFEATLKVSGKPTFTKAV